VRQTEVSIGSDRTLEQMEVRTSYQSTGTPRRPLARFAPPEVVELPSAHRPGSPYPAAPRREVIPPDPQHAFRALTHDFPSEICGWGAHPEYEIHLITKTHGSFIAGDHVGTFAPGHVSIMGPLLPHDWVSDLPPGQVAPDRDAVIQFTDEWVRECMRLIPELQEIDDILAQSARGIVFSGATAWRAAENILEVVRTEGTEQVASLFRLLSIFARAPQEEREVVHNANLLACSAVVRTSALRDEPLDERVAAAVATSAEAQRADGSWAYSAGPVGDWVDNFHTGYVLEALGHCAALVDGREVASFNEGRFNAPSPKADLEKIGFIK